MAELGNLHCRWILDFRLIFLINLMTSINQMSWGHCSQVAMKLLWEKGASMRKQKCDEWGCLKRLNHRGIEPYHRARSCGRQSVTAENCCNLISWLPTFVSVSPPTDDSNQSISSFFFSLENEKLATLTFTNVYLILIDGIDGSQAFYFAGLKVVSTCHSFVCLSFVSLLLSLFEEKKKTKLMKLIWLKGFDSTSRETCEWQPGHWRARPSPSCRWVELRVTSASFSRCSTAAASTTIATSAWTPIQVSSLPPGRWPVLTCLTSSRSSILPIDRFRADVIIRVDRRFDTFNWPGFFFFETRHELSDSSSVNSTSGFIPIGWLEVDPGSMTNWMQRRSNQLIWWLHSFVMELAGMDRVAQSQRV